jgi:hypothetical protein
MLSERSVQVVEKRAGKVWTLRTGTVMNFLVDPSIRCIALVPCCLPGIPVVLASPQAPTSGRSECNSPLSSG